MAAIHTTTSSILSSFLPRVSTASISNASRFTTLYSRQLSLPIIPSLAFAIPSAIHLNVPGLLEGIWESILKAVPKKKTSHMKKRTRQMAGKGLKDVTALNKCSACGHLKRAHLLCPYCVAGKQLQLVRKGYILMHYRAQRYVQGEEREGGRNHESRQRGRCIGSMGNERNGGLVLYRWIWREISCVA